MFLLFHPGPFSGAKAVNFQGCIGVSFGCGPLTGTMVNEGLVRDSLLKMVHNLGGHWHPVRGPHPMYHLPTQPKNTTTAVDAFGRKKLSTSL